VLDPFEREEELVGVRMRLPAEFAAVVGRDGGNRYTQHFVERHDALVEEIARGHGHRRPAFAFAQLDFVLSGTGCASPRRARQAAACSGLPHSS
jgi:hypothetical protein